MHWTPTNRLLGALTIALMLAGMAAPGRAQAQTASDTTAVRVAPGAADSGDDDATALAKKLQNPVGDLYSFPFQSNTNFNYGPNKGTQEILNIQPVIPIHLNDEWNIITRTILPLVWQPSLEPAHTVPFGTGPTTFTAFLSPKNPVNGFVWGIGPVVQLPTITDASLGSNVWGGGPSGVIVYLHGPIVAGVLVNNVWSFGGTSGLGGTRYNAFLTQPFFNYNFGGGWYVGTAPIATANWLAAGDKAWTVPVGAQAGRVIKLGGKLPVNLQIGAYYNVLRPEYGPTSQFRAQATLIF
jgi:hypothetical protein